MGIVIADVVGFGTLQEGEVALFSLTLLKQCFSAAESRGTRYCNTWGDAIVAYFESVDNALDYALEFCDLFRNKNWQQTPDDTFSSALSVRVALHAADVFISSDSKVPGGTIFGTQISLTARIEPVTQPNEVFVSEAAYAILAAHRRTNVAFRNMGRITLPKEGRDEVIYWARRKGESPNLPPTSALSGRISGLAVDRRCSGRHCAPNQKSRSDTCMRS